MIMIKLVKLVTGEDVVSAVDRKADGNYILKKPYRLVLAREGLGSIPLCPFAETEVFEVSKSHVVWEAEPDDEIRNSYVASTGSIVVASGGIVIP